MYHNISNVSTEYFSQLSDALNIGQFEPNCLLVKTLPSYFPGLQRHQNTRTVDKTNSQAVRFDTSTAPGKRTNYKH